MTANLSILKTTEERRGSIDVRDEQAALVASESASLSALKMCSEANAGLVSFLEKTEISIVHPRARQLLGRAQDAMQHAFDLTQKISDAHKIAQGMAESRKDIEVVMSGGILKDDKEARDFIP